MVLTRTFGPKRDEVTESWKKSVRKPEVKRPLGRSRRRWEGNIKVDLGRWYGVD
jgi:hypothetical protein